jgi:hypothetical protein
MNQIACLRADSRRSQYQNPGRLIADRLVSCLILRGEFETAELQPIVEAFRVGLTFISQRVTNKTYGYIADS